MDFGSVIALLLTSEKVSKKKNTIYYFEVHEKSLIKSTETNRLWQRADTNCSCCEREHVSLQMKKTKRKKSQMERLIISGKELRFGFRLPNNPKFFLQSRLLKATRKPMACKPHKPYVQV